MGIGSIPHLCVTHPSGPLFPPFIQGSQACPASQLPGESSAKVKGSELGNTSEFSFHHPETHSSPDTRACPKPCLGFPICQVSPCLPNPLLPPPPFQRLVNMFSQTLWGSVGWAQGGTWRLRGRKAPGPGVNTCNRQELQLAGLGLVEELSWLEAVDPTDRQTDRWADTRSDGQALSGWSPFQGRPFPAGMWWRN